MKTSSVMALNLGLALLGAGCQRELPQDDSTRSGVGLQVTYDHGATHAEWGRTRLTIQPDGKAEVVRSGRQYGRSAVTNAFALSAEEMKQVSAAIEANDFFKLKESYENPWVNDGFSAFIRVEMDGKEHSVTVLNKSVDEFSAISRVLDELARVHTPEPSEETPEEAVGGE